MSGGSFDGGNGGGGPSRREKSDREDEREREREREEAYYKAMRARQKKVEEGRKRDEIRGYSIRNIGGYGYRPRHTEEAGEVTRKWGAEGEPLPRQLEVQPDGTWKWTTNVAYPWPERQKALEDARKAREDARKAREDAERARIEAAMPPNVRSLQSLALDSMASKMDHPGYRAHLRNLARLSARGDEGDLIQNFRTLSQAKTTEIKRVDGELWVDRGAKKVTPIKPNLVRFEKYDEEEGTTLILCHSSVESELFVEIILETANMNPPWRGYRMKLERDQFFTHYDDMGHGHTSEMWLNYSPDGNFTLELHGRFKDTFPPYFFSITFPKYQWESFIDNELERIQDDLAYELDLDNYDYGLDDPNGKEKESDSNDHDSPKGKGKEKKSDSNDDDDDDVYVFHRDSNDDDDYKFMGYV